MKRKVLSLVIAFAMIMTVFAGMTTVANAEGESSDVAFTVYTADFDEAGNYVNLKVKSEYTAEEFEQLATEATIGSLYNKSGWQLVSSDKYVDINDILGKEGIKKSNVKKVYAYVSDDGGTVYSKQEYTNYLKNPAYFYGDTKGSSETMVEENAVEVPFGVTITNAKTAVGTDEKASETLKNVVNAKKTYMMTCGSLNVNDNAGKRFASGVAGIVLDVDEGADCVVKMYGQRTKDNKKIKYTFGSKSTTTLMNFEKAGYKLHATFYKAVGKNSTKYEKMSEKEITAKGFELYLTEGLPGRVYSCKAVIDIMSGDVLVGTIKTLSGKAIWKDKDLGAGCVVKMYGNQMKNKKIKFTFGSKSTATLLKFEKAGYKLHAKFYRAVGKNSTKYVKVSEKNITAKNFKLMPKKGVKGKVYKYKAVIYIKYGDVVVGTIKTQSGRAVWGAKTVR